MRIKKGRMKWGSIFIAFVAAFGAMFGLLSGKITKAFEGDYWTITDENGLSLTVESVTQNGLSLVPMDDGEGEYYFAVANNTDSVRVGFRVNGMQAGATYYYYPTNDYFSGRVDLTSADNGSLLYEDLTPHVYFQDEDDCHGDCWVDPMSGKYYVGAGISKEGGYGVQKNLIVRPTNVGSQNIDIISVKQNNVDLTMTNNEFQVTDYGAPIAVTYKFKNLEIGKNYSAEIGRSNYYQFKPETTTVTETREFTLDLTSRHINTSVYLYSSDGSEQVMLYFKVADSNFRPLGDIIIDEIEQGGVALVPNANTSGWQREYTFSANDAQGLTVRMHTTSATAAMNYYVIFNMSSGWEGYSSEEPLMVTGAAFEGEGIVLTVPSGFGLSDASPFTLTFDVNTVGTNVYGYSSQRVVYKNYANPQNTSDSFKFNFYEDENVPRYDAAMFYSDGTRIESDRISPVRHDAEHPLLLEVKGERYDDAQTYNVRAKAGVAYGANLYDHTFTATGAQLNEGVQFTLDGLTLALPEFDPSGTTSGYELSYEFSLEIDGLKQTGGMFYRYDGWLKSSMTYNNGEVVAMGSGGGVGGDIYSTINGATVRKSSLNGSRGATLQYLASGFDDDLSYDFKVYYNGNVGSDWWSASAGNVIENGVLTGSYLNSNGFTISIATPSNDSEGMLYTLVLSRNGKLVALARDYIDFSTEPRIESFKFVADSDSFMQTDRSSYRVASGTDIVATLTGDGFDNSAEYKLWVSYEGYRYDEGLTYPQYVDLSALNNSVVVTGAQLNAGYVFDLDYVEAFDGVNFVEVGFAVSDRDADEPSWYGQTGNGSYAGHGIHIDYVNDDEVFRDDGYQVNDDGTITNVSQPDEPHGEIPVDDRTPAEVNVVPEGGTLTVVSERPVVVVGFRNGEWVKLYEWDVTTNGEERTNHYSIGDCDEVKVALKGDGNMDREISTADSNLVTRSLISSTLRPYRELSRLESIILDMDGDDVISTADSNLITRSFISPTLRPYRPIQW